MMFLTASQPPLRIPKGHDMRRTIFRPASASAVAAILLLAGCGEGDEATSAGTVEASLPTTAAPTTVTTVPATTTVAPAATAAARCNSVSFTSNPEDVASDIRATGLSCADAEALVGKIGPQVGSTSSPPRVEADGFVCLRASTRSGDHGPPVATFECTSGATKVTFGRNLVT